MELSQRIYDLRKARGMTQQELADRLNVSRQAVSRWEMGTAVPELEHLKNMAGIFAVTIDELVTGDAPKPAAPKKMNGRKWLIAWAVTSGVALLACLGWLYWVWKKEMLIAIHPLTLLTQLVNVPLKLGLAFLAAYLICGLVRKL